MTPQFFRSLINGIIDGHGAASAATADSESFWVLGNYKKTTKRIEDGYRLCNELQQMLEERAEIEENYAKNLRSWSRKWQKNIDNGNEYGTMADGWKAVLAEAEQLAVMHSNIHDTLLDEPCQQLKEWQSKNYHYTLITLKERKEMDEHFKKAQKPWADLMKKIQKAKTSYYNACKKHKQLIRLCNSFTDQTRTTRSREAFRTMQERRLRIEDAVVKCRLRYIKALNEANTYSSFYVVDMTTNFDKCQAKENERLDFFKEILQLICKCLHLPRVQDLSKIYEEFQSHLDQINAPVDLEWWSNNYGVNTTKSWPKFAEYQGGEFAYNNYYSRSLSSTRHSSESEFVGCQKFRSISANNFQNAFSLTMRNLNCWQRHRQLQQSDNETLAMSGRNQYECSGPSTAHTETHPREESAKITECAESHASEYKGKNTVLVKAMYSYEAVESDELSFSEGAIFEKLQDEDDMGWCTGRKDGRIGLYPSGFAQILNK